MFFSERSEKRINKYIQKLNDNNFSSYEQKKLVKLFKIVNNLTNFLIMNIILSLIVFGSGILISYLQNKQIIRNDTSLSLFKENIVLVCSTISSLLLVLNRVFTIFLFFRVLFSRSKYIRFGIKTLTFLSIIPFLSVIFLFIVKYKIKHIYKKKK